MVEKGLIFQTVARQTSSSCLTDGVTEGSR